MLFDWLLVGHIVATNPAAAVRGPAYSVTKGKTPVLDESEAKRLLASIESDTPVGQRDRAIIATMIYTFGRISAVTLMDVGDYYPNGKRWWVRLREKGGKHHEMPAHHKLEEYLDDYLRVWGQARDSRHPLFITAPRWNREFTLLRLSRTDAWAMVKRRAKAAGVITPISNHSFRGTGITNFILNGGTVEQAQKMAAHADPRTTKLYDRTGDQITLDEVERISI